jgi:dynein intermediate chain 1, axonemal
VLLWVQYWDDPADEVRQAEGTLLPLWKFYHRRAKRKHVTSLAWNPAHADLFAIGYGSFDFLRQGSGLVACFSLKNPSFPEFTVATDSGMRILAMAAQ